MSGAQQFRPMLSATYEKGVKLMFPLLASAKLDGLRCIIIDGVPVSRNLKPFRNKYIQTMLAGLPPFDGEIICGEPFGLDVWNRSNSGCQSASGEPDFKLYVFDYAHHEMINTPFEDRLRMAHALCGGNEFLVPHFHQLIENEEQLWEFETKCVHSQFEGIMIRSLEGPYKYGRSTVREGFLMKIKRFYDAEAEVTGWVERFHNANEAKINALGLTERSTSKANKVATGTLGALICKYEDGTVFELGSGYTEADRVRLWQVKETLVGQHVNFTYQDRTPDGSFRFPVWRGFRSDHK